MGSSGSLLGVSLSLALLVHLSPGLSPVELNRSDSLSEQRSNLVADEEVDLTVLGNETLSLSRVDTVLGELAKFSLDNHYQQPTTGLYGKDGDNRNRSFFELGQPNGNFLARPVFYGENQSLYITKSKTRELTVHSRFVRCTRDYIR